MLRKEQDPCYSLDMKKWTGPTISEMRKATGMSQRSFSDHYGIPKRTIENWEAFDKDPAKKGARQAPPYVYHMLYQLIYGEKYDPGSDK